MDTSRSRPDADTESSSGGDETRSRDSARSDDRAHAHRERPFLVSSARRARRPPSEIRERIYRVALRRIRAHGYDDTPVSAITRESDVAKGTFFNHFPTKEHLLARALDEMLDRAFRSATRDTVGSDAIARVLDDLALELAGDPPLARALIPRAGFLPPPTEAQPGNRASGVGDGEDTGDRETGDGAGSIRGLERLRRWVRDRLAESLRSAVPLEETDDQTLSVLILAAFEATLREWLNATDGEPPFPRRLLHGRVAYLLASAGLPRPPDLK